MEVMGWIGYRMERGIYRYIYTPQTYMDSIAKEYRLAFFLSEQRAVFIVHLSNYRTLYWKRRRWGSHTRNVFWQLGPDWLLVPGSCLMMGMWTEHLWPSNHMLRLALVWRWHMLHSSWAHSAACIWIQTSLSNGLMNRMIIICGYVMVIISVSAFLFNWCSGGFNKFVGPQ